MLIENEYNLTEKSSSPHSMIFQKSQSSYIQVGADANYEALFLKKLKCRKKCSNKNAALNTTSAKWKKDI